MTRLQTRLNDMNQSVNRITDMIHLSSYQHSVDHYKKSILRELQHIQSVLEQLDKEEVLKLNSNAVYGISTASFMNVDTTQKEVNEGFVQIYMEELKKHLSDEVEVIYQDTDTVSTILGPSTDNLAVPDWSDRW